MLCGRRLQTFCGITRKNLVSVMITKATNWKWDRQIDIKVCYVRCPQLWFLGWYFPSMGEARTDFSHDKAMHLMSDIACSVELFFSPKTCWSSQGKQPPSTKKACTVQLHRVFLLEWFRTSRFLRTVCRGRQMQLYSLGWISTPTHAGNCHFITLLLEYLPSGYLI